MSYYVDIPSSDNRPSNEDSSLIIIAIGVGCAVVILMIIGIVIYIICCKKKLCCQDKHIYDVPSDLSTTPSENNSDVFINPAPELGEARTMTTNFNSQEHQALHSSNDNHTADQNIPNSDNPQTSTATITAADIICNTQVSTTSNVDQTAATISIPHGALNADTNDDTGGYAPITVPPSDEPINATDHSTEEDQYGATMQLPSDESPTVDN